ncbi:MAG: adenylyl-sulfate kinase [Acidiferrobacteraceae bacterium]
MSEHQPGAPRITRADWERHQGYRAALLWFTGLPGSGKSTLAYALQHRFHQEGRRAVVLDGDRVRSGLSQDLGFTDADRHEQLRRVAEVAQLFIESGVLVIAALITPRAADHAWLRERFDANDLIEVYCRCPASVCAERDPKGHYAKARQGSMSGFTGVSAPYEAPLNPDVLLDTDRHDLGECVDLVLAECRHRGILGETAGSPRREAGKTRDR